MTDTLEECVFLPSRDTENGALALVYSGGCQRDSTRLRLRDRQMAVGDFAPSASVPCPLCGGDITLVPVPPADSDQDAAP